MVPVLEEHELEPIQKYPRAAQELWPIQNGIAKQGYIRWRNYQSEGMTLV